MNPFEWIAELFMGSWLFAMAIIGFIAICILIIALVLISNPNKKKNKKRRVVK